MSEPKVKFLGPIKSFFLFHVIDNPLFWVGIFTILLFINEVIAANIYTALSGTFLARLFAQAYEWGAQHAAFWWGVLFVGISIVASWVRFKVTRFVVENGVLVVTRGKFTLNPINLFQRLDHTVALNLIYDVDVRKSLFQYVFGGGDVYVRTATNDIFHLEFVNDPHQLREYLLEHSGIKNKPIIGIY